MPDICKNARKPYALLNRRNDWFIFSGKNRKKVFGPTYKNEAYALPMTHQLSPGCLSQRNSHQIHEETAHYSIVCGALEMNSVSLTRTAEVKCDGYCLGYFAAVILIQVTSREQTGCIFKSERTKQLSVCYGTPYHSLK